MKRRHLTQGFAAAWAVGALPSRWPPSRRPAGAGREGAALRLPGRRDRLRPGADQRHLFAHRHRAHLRRAAHLRPPGAAVQAQAAGGGGDARGRRTTSAPSPSASGRASTSPTTRPSRASGASCVAEDYVYAVKRIYDPKLKSPGQSILEDEGIIGLQQLYDDALKNKKPFDYDREVEGLRALDRYTLRVRLRESRPRHLYAWAARDVFGAVAREVVEFYGDRIMDHPVGTGPFRLAEWRRSSRIVLERNPGYRDTCTTPSRTPTTPKARRWSQRFKGRRLPMIDRVEIAIIEQAQPRWLSFLNGEQDFLERLPNEFVDQAVPGGKVAPNLAKRGVRA